MAVITALVSKKGGVGKTTTAVNLAAALAHRNHRVLLIDLDSQASASLSLGARREELAPSSADVLLAGLPVAQAVRATATAGLDLVTGSVDLVAAEAELSSFHNPNVRLARVLEPVRDRYDYIFLDCPPAVSLLPTNALMASDTFLIPVVPQFLAITGIQNLLRFTERLGWRPGGRVRLLGIVLTMVDYRNRATRINVGRIREEYGERVLAVEIRINTRLAEAPEHGQTIFQHDPDASGAKAYSLLAEEIELRNWALRRQDEALLARPLPPSTL